MAIKEKISREDAYVFDIINHPVFCGEFVRNTDRVSYEDVFKFDPYQKEMLCDFSPYVSIACARAIGKTLMLVSMLTWLLINNLFPEEYLVYLVPNKSQLEPVWTGLVRDFRSNSFLKQFIERNKGINSSSHTVKLLNSSSLLCRIAGATGGANVIGLHTPFEIVDESGYFPFSSWLELQPTLNTWQEGYRQITSGVPTGLREQNVLYHTDIENDGFTKHRVSAYDNPRFSEEDEERAIKLYGGRESEDFAHFVLGQHGSPVFSVFDRRLFEIKSYEVYRLIINGTKLSRLQEYIEKVALLPPVPPNNGILFGVDLGYCYSEDTDVLTNRGWLKHKDITTKDKIACFNTDKNKIIWDNPLYVWEQSYKGDMIEVSGKSTNFMVSPEHSVWVSKYSGNKSQEYKKLKAKDLLKLKNNKFRVKIAAYVDNTEGPNTFKVPYYYCKRKDRNNKSTTVGMGVWLQFLAWFISEGSATANKNWEINITQAKDRYSSEIENVLNQLPYTVNKKEFTTKWGKQQINWRITCKELCLWLRRNCGVHSQNKKIPDFVFNCSSNNQELFLKTLLLGDGTRLNCSRSPSYSSSSNTLLDQVQRLAISLGYSSTKSFYNKYNMGKVSIMNRGFNELKRNKNVKRVNYDGKIYCLKTNTGFYVTRRKGKIAIQGNTDPTAIVILYINNKDKLKFHCRIQLNKVSYNMQDKFIDLLDTKFRPSIIGVDDGGSGKPVIHRMQESEDYLHKDYNKRLIPINFSSSIAIGENLDGEEITSRTKPFSVSVLQDYSNSHRIIYSSTDPEMMAELERMTYMKNPMGTITYKTLTPLGGKRGQDHFTSALLCGCLAYYLENESFIPVRKKKKLFSARWL